MVRLCKDMGLQHDLSTSQISPSEIEKRKRIFWAVYCYDVMMSIENGTRPHFDTKDCLLDIPRVLSDETPEHGKIMQFVLLIQIMRNQADIVDFLLRRKGMGIEASAEYKRISNQLNTTVGMIQSSTKFPQKENMCYAVCFLYLSSCFATILLHRPYHLSVCVESALNIKRIIGLVLECDAFEDMYCSIRGLQQIVYYLSAAVTVFKECHREEDRAQTLLLTQRLASISPATEVIGRQMNVRPLLKDARHIASVKKANMEYEYMNLCDMNNQSLLDLLYYDERH
ncbi:hypothetical protein BDB01DRAFT_730189 [Pilobolus umbonatus]|nr:hypothetical protein BDB01DRAFT_730189 [Pilobolus umbonatus]